MDLSSQKNITHSSNKKTILIAVNIGFSARYLLRTDIIKRLKKAGTRIVIVTPNADEPYFRKEFEDEAVFVEKYEFEKCRAYYNGSRIQYFFRIVRLHTLPGITKDSILNARLTAFKKECLNFKMKGKIQFYLVAMVRALLLRSSFLRQKFLDLECRLFAGDFHRKIFEQYKPSLLITTSLGYFDFDQYIMREARKHRVKVVAVILSWDNSSSKGLPGAKADVAISWSKAMKAELVKYYEVSPEKIFVSGVAYFDIYFRSNSFLSRKALFTKYGMDPERKVIFFGTRSPNKYPWTGDCIRLLGEAIEQDSFSFPCQLLVRLHPNHYQVQNGRYRYQRILDEYEDIKRRYRWVFFNKPQILSHLLSSDMPRSEMIELGSILKYSDVMVNYYSTLMLEASIFDLPIINFVKYGHNILLGKENRAAINFEHIRRVIYRKAEVTVLTDEDLINAISDYLVFPEKDKEGRKRVMLEECGPNRGRAGKVIADYLLGLLKN